LCCGLLLAATYLPGLSQVLALSRPTPSEWGLILGFSLLPLLVGQAGLILWDRKRRGGQG
jgi:Ca2+-transporting ATPase